MNKIVGQTHPVLKEPAEVVTLNSWPSRETVQYIVDIALDLDLLYLTAPQVGINSNFFVGCLEDGIYRAYVNPKFDMDEDYGYVERVEKTPHNNETFAVRRPVTGVLYHMLEDGQFVEAKLSNDAAANAHAAYMFLEGKPPWVYEKIGDW